MLGSGGRSLMEAWMVVLDDAGKDGDSHSGLYFPTSHTGPYLLHTSLVTLLYSQLNNNT